MRLIWKNNSPEFKATLGFKWWDTIIYTLSALMVLLDYGLTKIALTYFRFFETNPFSNRFGLGVHCAILISLLTLLCLTHWKLRYIRNITLSARIINVTFLLIWGINNYISITYLWGVIF